MLGHGKTCRFLLLCSRNLSTNLWLPTCYLFDNIKEKNRVQFSTSINFFCVTFEFYIVHF